MTLSNFAQSHFINMLTLQLFAAHSFSSTLRVQPSLMNHFSLSIRLIPFIATTALVSSSMFAVGCGKAVVPAGIAVGAVGHELQQRSVGLPKGAEVCAMTEATGQASVDRSMAQACDKTRKSDEVWRMGFDVLGVHAQRLGALASGVDPKDAGVLSAALAGSDVSVLEAQSPEETSAKEAIARLKGLVGKEDADLGASLTASSADVKTLCSGLDNYLSAQIKAVAPIRTELEKKRKTKTDRRCYQSEGRITCVSESVLDKLTYANSYARLAEIEASHMAGRDRLRMFCSAHQRLEKAAANKTLSDKETVQGMLEDIKKLPRTRPNYGSE